MLERVRSRRVAAALGALAVVALAAGVILGTSLNGTSAGASQTSKASGATSVQRRDLVETDTESGTLSYAHPQTVFNRISGTITWLPSVGQTIHPGETLYTVNGAPVVLMDGSFPAYRALSEGVSDGADVKELQQNLIALGFDPEHQITVNSTFDAATAAAVERWQGSLGETETGTISLGQVVFLPGPQRVSAVETVLGSTGSSGGSGNGSGSGSGSGSTASLHAGPPRPEFVSLTSTTSTTTTTTTTTTSSRSKPPRPAPKRASTTPSTLAALLALLRAETAELQRSRSSSSAGAGGSTGRAGNASSATGSSRSGGSRNASASSSSTGSATGAAGTSSGTGSAGASAQPILQTTSTKLVVTVDLDATKQAEAVVGEPVTVQMPDGTTVDGKITEVSPVAQSSSSSSGSGSGGGGGASGGGSSSPSATIPVTIALSGRHRTGGLDQAAVSVNFEQQKARDVLSVPVSALLATAGGGYAVQEAGPPHQLIPVTPGLFAAGYVQISGAQLYQGLQVTDSQG